jgi:NTP pyrophosphatase (non-canonical NTP hydrolase)
VEIDMQPNEYQRLALRTEKTEAFVNHVVRGGDALSRPLLTPDRDLSRLMHAAMGISTESGELMDMLKKHVVYGKPMDDINIVEECGDLLWYIALALDAVGFTIEDAMVRNIAKLAKRYPDGFSEYLAQNRDLDAERAALEQADGDPR